MTQGMARAPVGGHFVALVVLLLAARRAESSRCNGDATPGPRNLNPIDTAAPVLVKQVRHGKHRNNISWFPIMSRTQLPKLR